MKKAVLLLALGGALLLPALLQVREHRGSPEKGTSPAQAADGDYPPGVEPGLPSAPPDHRLQRHADGSVDFLPALRASRNIRRDQTREASEANLGEIQVIFEHYRYVFGENPAGVENFEFTEPLLGRNPRKIRFIASDSPALEENQLIDQWGRPLFFHPLSGEQMEVRSAGPDGRFWTDDDTVAR